MTESRVGVLGATGLVGKCLISQLIRRDAKIYAYSRQSKNQTFHGLIWRKLSSASCQFSDQLDSWTCALPIWILPEYFPLIEASGARRVVVLSSTSIFTKFESSNQSEIALAKRLIAAEDRFVAWAISRNIDWVILRPTLIYGFGEDKNISEIARFIQRFGFFPILGKAQGLRQPIHAEDVAIACASALKVSVAANHAYNISGGETIPYREMILRVFSALGRHPILIPVPLLVFRVALSMLNYFPRYRHWSAAMAERMNQDLVFENNSSNRGFDFNPRPFALTKKDCSKNIK